jgi:hypothetical protein
MALPTYLEIVNDVLTRMRETTVSTVSQSTTSTLVGKFVNDAKRQINDAFDWSALNTAINITLVAGQTNNYTLTGSTAKYKFLDIINTTKFYQVGLISAARYDQLYYSTATPPNTIINYVALDGLDSNGDQKVKFYPAPSSADNVRFSIIVPENDLSGDNDSTKMPKDAIIFGALARALVERGEDGGLSSSEAFSLYRSALADAIAIENSRDPSKFAFEAI